MLPQQQPRYQQSALFAHNPYVGNFQLWQKQDKLSCETMRNARDAMKSNPYIGYVHHGGRGIGDLLWEEEKTKPVVTHVEIAKKERWKARHLTTGNSKKLTCLATAPLHYIACRQRRTGT